MTQTSRIDGNDIANGLALSTWFYAAIFCAIVVALIASNWTSIDAFNIEYGDFAANSILIQDAKEGRLWIGNYSRVGFNHPGPAILDVLAIGEAFVFDRLDWVPSPFSGQLVAVAFYNAFWSTLIIRLWASMTTRKLIAFAGATTFLATTALLDVRFLTGPWFPHLYYFPFATFLFAASRLAVGASNRLQALALSLGFLINGHVAFVPVCAIILLVVLAINRAHFRRTSPERVLTSARWWKGRRRPVLFGALTILVFLIPLGVETTLHFPGPLHDYLSFGRGHYRNTLIQSLRFVAMYWGGLPFLILPVFYWTVSYRFRFEDLEWSRTVRALLGVVAGASLALFVYAAFGVDDLYSAYIGLFYCAVPASIASLCVACALQSSAFRRHGRAAMLAALLAVSVAGFKLNRENGYTNFYRAPEIASIREALSRYEGTARIVLDLEAGPEVWPVVAGVEADARRHREDLLCIGENWHILFSKHARCTAEERASSRHLVVARSDRSAPDAIVVAKGLGISFYEVPGRGADRSVPH